MGHSGCGGIKNGFHMCKENKFVENSAIPNWLKILLPAYKKLSNEDNIKMVDELEKISILTSLENLSDYPFLKRGLDANDINLYGIWNDIGTGSIEVYNQKTKAFEKI